VVSSETEGTLQLQEGAHRIPHTRTDRSRSAVEAGMRRIYRSVRLPPRAFENLARRSQELLIVRGEDGGHFRIPSRAHGSMRSYRDRTDS